MEKTDWLTTLQDLKALLSPAGKPAEAEKQSFSAQKEAKHKGQPSLFGALSGERTPSEKQSKQQENGEAPLSNPALDSAATTQPFNGSPSASSFPPFASSAAPSASSFAARQEKIAQAYDAFFTRHVRLSSRLSHAEVPENAIRLGKTAAPSEENAIRLNKSALFHPESTAKNTAGEESTENAAENIASEAENPAGAAARGKTKTEKVKAASEFFSLPLYPEGF